MARVILDSPLPQLDRVFEYAIPESLRGTVLPGARIKVPLRTGGRIVQAYVAEVTDVAEYSGKLAEIDSVTSAAQVLTPQLRALARAVADRQAGTASDVLRLAIPTRSARLEQQWLDAQATAGADEQPADLSVTEPAAQSAPTAAATTASSPAIAAEFIGATADALLSATPARLALQPTTGVTGHVPNSLLQLVTLGAELVRRGRSAIVLVPDFRDVDLALEAAGDALPAEQVRRFDGRLKPKPRYHEFLRALEPRPQLIIGTRTAVYAPAHRLGAIVIWNDDDESFDEPRSPYAHTREVACIRATQEAVGMVFAAHSPSLEVMRLVQLGWCTTWRAPQLPAPRVIPAAATLGDEPYAQQARIPSAAWRAAKAGIERGPVLIQVGRAGYLPGLACRRCLAPARCHTCQGMLAQLRSGAIPSCTVCGELHGNWRCDVCEGTELRARGSGHKRTAEELGRAFPGVNIIVADGERELVRIPDAPALVIATRGTEPVAEGGYRAVILLDTEGALARESLEAQADALRAWSNAAALVATGGEVVITGAQSAPIVALRDWRQAALVQTELEDRYVLQFPPAIRLVAITGTRDEVEAALRRLDDLFATSASGQAGEAPINVLGPTPVMADTPGSAGGDTAALEMPASGSPATAPNAVRAIVRFHYRDGAAVAQTLKAELVARATATRRTGRGPRYQSTLRVHFDAPGVF